MAREKKEKAEKTVAAAAPAPVSSGGGFGINALKLRHMKVGDKFSYVFNRVTILVLVATIALGVSIIYDVIQYRTMYKKYLVTEELVGEGIEHQQSLSKNVLYIIAASEDSVKAARMEAATADSEELSVVVEEMKAIYPSSDLVKTFEQHLAETNNDAQRFIEAANTGAPSSELYEIFEEDLVPVLTEMKNDMDTLKEAANNNASSAYRTALAIAAVLGVIAIIFIVILFITINDAKKKLTNAIVEPVSEVVDVANQMAEGHLDLQINYDSDDELGGLTKTMQHTTTVIHGIVEDLTDVMQRLGGGDLVHGSRNPDCYIGDFYPIAKEIRAFRDSLAGTMGEIKDSSSQVSQGAQNMAQGAQDLAEGSTDQAASVQELTASVASVMEQTEALADAADKGNRMAGQVKTQADTGIEKMGQVVEAMESITQSSNQIASIIQTIEDIASQTNLLSLNASIEAARAGEAGKGFAVVADEIRALAAQSGEAAGHIRDVIQTTVDSVNHGNTVVEETNEALGQVAQSITEIQQIMQENSEEASNQKNAMQEINRGIEQISQVVQANSATAEESNAISEELSAQSQSLNALINKFEIGEG